jgi:hypothetical protein
MVVGQVATIGQSSDRASAEHSDDALNACQYGKCYMSTTTVAEKHDLFWTTRRSDVQCSHSSINASDTSCDTCVVCCPLLSVLTKATAAVTIKHYQLV